MDFFPKQSLQYIGVTINFRIGTTMQSKIGTRWQLHHFLLFSQSLQFFTLTKTLMQQSIPRLHFYDPPPDPSGGGYSG